MLALFGLQSGSSVLIAQYHGKGDAATINRVLGIGFGLSFTISLLIALSVLVFPMQVYSLTTHDRELAAIAAEFGRIAAPSILLNSLTMIYLSAQRSMENPRLGMYILGAGMALKTVLNWLLIFGMLGFPALGIKGAAFATLSSRVFEFTVTLFYAMRNRRFRLQFDKLLRPGMIIFMDFLKYSLPVVINETVWGFGATLYTVIFGHLPDAVAALASYAIIMNLERMLGSIYSGLGHATAILVGKDLGAGRRDSAYQSGFTMLILTTGFGVVSALAMALLSRRVILPYVFPLFGATAATLLISGPILLIMIASLPFRALNFVCLVGLFRGGGDVRAGMVIDLCCMYLVAIPLSALAGFMYHASAPAVFFCMAMEEFIKGFIVLWRFRQKRWLQNITR
jgi:putative MATE family efflux protein